MSPRSQASGSVARYLVVALVVALLAVVAGIALLELRPVTSKSSTTPSVSTASNASSSSSGAGRVQSAGASCITVVPYDALQGQFEGCSYSFSVLFNGDDYTQRFPNGTEEVNKGWTLLINASQGGIPSENVTFGWDPAGPNLTSGERLPTPDSSSLFNGNLAIDWGLYNSTDPRLYAWIVTPSVAQPQQSTTASSSSCPASPWPSNTLTSFQPTVKEIEQNPAFLALTNGLCYSFQESGNATYLSQSFTTFVFNQYNGTIIYPCGTYPANLTVSQIQVNAVLNGTSVKDIMMIDLNNDTASLNIVSCPILPAVVVQSVMWLPPSEHPNYGGGAFEVTLEANYPTPIINLTAVLSVAGNNVTLEFRSVNASNPLLPRHAASLVEGAFGFGINSDSIYPMTIIGTFQNGQTFSVPVKVEVQAIPP